MSWWCWWLPISEERLTRKSPWLSSWSWCRCRGRAWAPAPPARTSGSRGSTPSSCRSAAPAKRVDTAGVNGTICYNQNVTVITRCAPHHYSSIIGDILKKLVGVHFKFKWQRWARSWEPTKPTCIPRGSITISSRLMAHFLTRFSVGLSGLNIVKWSRWSHVWLPITKCKENIDKEQFYGEQKFILPVPLTVSSQYLLLCFSVSTPLLHSIY